MANCKLVASPIVSVVIPAFQHAMFVREALLSVLAQQVDLEVLLCDDGSGDATFDVAQSVGDPRVKLWRHDHNLGVDVTLNELILRAKGRYVAILNSDDRFHVQRLRYCLPVLMAEEADLVGTDIVLIDDSGNRIESHWWLEAYEKLKRVWRQEQDWLAALWAGNLFMTSSNFVFTRQLWQRIGGFRPFRYVSDYDFLLRALAAGARFFWFDKPLLDYRLHAKNTIFEKPLAANLETAELLRETLPLLTNRCRIPPAAWRYFTGQWKRIEQLEVAILTHEQHLVKEKYHKRLDACEQKVDACHVRLRVVQQEANQLVAQREAQLADLLMTLGGSASSGLVRLRNWLWQLPLRIKSNVELACRLVHNPPARFRNFSALRRWLRNHPEVKVLSFDVFDTLLFRLVEPPERIQHRLAQWVAKRLDCSVQRVLWVRQEVEKRMRQESLAAGFDYESHWQELISRWVAQLVPFADEAQQLALSDAIRQEELRLEELALRAKPNALLFVRWAKRQGYRLIAISDMYLGGEQIRALLDRCGFSNCFEDIFVSSEEKVGKYSGRLFERVLEKLHVPAEAVVHVGDNLHSDALMPAQLGIKAAFLDEPFWQHRRRELFIAARCSHRYGGIWPGREVAHMVADALAFDAAAKQRDPLFRYGLLVLGPIFSVFTLGLLEAVSRDRPQRIYFLARDGAIFQQMYESARSFWPDLPASDYLYISRRSVTAAAVADGLTSEHMRFALLHPKQQGVASLCKTFGLPEERFRFLAERYGFVPFAAPIDRNDPRIARFLADREVQEEVRRCGEEAKGLLYDYLAQHDFFDLERVAIVDIGWNATIQRYLEQIFALSSFHYPYVHGYYFARIDGIHSEPLQFGSATGLFSDRRRGSPWEQAIFDFEELFEQGARALHATTVGYQRNEDGVVIPTLKSDDAPDRQQELKANPAVAAIQAGVLVFWRHFLVAQHLTGYCFEMIKPYALALAERAVVYPTFDELTVVAKLIHTEDLGHDHLLDLVGPALTWRALRHPWRALRALFSLSWPYAALSGWWQPWLAAIVRALFLRHHYLGK